jgi:hypothetical protein
MDEVGAGPGSNGQLLNEAAAGNVGNSNLEQTGASTMDAESIDPSLGGAVQQLRSSWHCAAVILFCRAFGSRLGIKPFATDLFEETLVEPRERAGSFLDDLVPRLLSRCAVALQCSAVCHLLQQACLVFANLHHQPSCTAVLLCFSWCSLCLCLAGILVCLRKPAGTATLRKC